MSQPAPGAVATTTQGGAEQPQQPEPPPASPPPEFYPVLMAYLKPDRRKEPTKKLFFTLMATCRGLRDAIADIISVRVDLHFSSGDPQLQQGAQRIHAVTKLFRTVHLHLHNHIQGTHQSGAPPVAEHLEQLTSAAAALSGDHALPTIRSVSLTDVAPAIIHPTITHLILDLSWPLTPQQLQRQLIALPQLTHLTIPQDAQPFLTPGIHLPGVTSLETWSTSGSALPAAQGQLPLLPLQFPNIRCYDRYGIDDADLELLLSLPLPQLRSLKCESLALTRSFQHVAWPAWELQVFSVDPDALGLLPLEHIPRIQFGVWPHFFADTSTDPIRVGRVKALMARSSPLGMDTAHVSTKKQATAQDKRNAVITSLPLLSALPRLGRLWLFDITATMEWAAQLGAGLPSVVRGLALDDSCPGWDKPGTTTALFSALPPTVEVVIWVMRWEHTLPESELLAACRAARWPVAVQLYRPEGSAVGSGVLEDMVARVQGLLTAEDNPRVTLEIKE